MRFFRLSYLFALAFSLFLGAPAFADLGAPPPPPPSVAMQAAAHPGAFLMPPSGIETVGSPMLRRGVELFEDLGILWLVALGFALIAGRGARVRTLAPAVVASAVVFVAGLAMAQVDGGLSGPLPPVDPSDPLAVVQQLLGILGTWHSAGLVASLIAVVNMLVNLTKLPAFDKLVGDRPAIRPMIAVVSGALLAGLGAAASGVALPGALLAGLLAGLGSAGLHELVVALSDAPKQAARQAGDAIAEGLKKGDAAAKAQWEAQKAHIDEAFKLADEAARLKALADLANAKPVGG